MRSPLVPATLAILAVLALACGEGDASEPGVPAAATTATAAVPAGTGDGAVDVCARQASCGCLPEGQDQAACVAGMREMMGYGMRGETFSCFAGLPCTELCGTASSPQGLSCSAMFNEDQAAVARHFEQLSAQQQQIHETNMQIIGNMGTTGVKVVDEYGQTQYEY